MNEGIELIFCRICGNSIPQKDLLEGLALDLEGKKICGPCGGKICASLPGSASRKSAVPGERGGLLFGLLIVFVTVLGVSFFLDRRQIEREKGLREAMSELVRGREDLAVRIDGIERSTSALGQTVRALQSDFPGVLGEIRDGVALIQGKISKGDGRKNGTLRKLRELEEVVRDLAARHAAGESSMNGGFERLEERIATLSRSLDEFRRVSRIRGIPSAEAGRRGASSGGGSGKEAPLPDLPEKLLRLVDRLEDPDAAVRWTAVDEILKAGDERVVPYLLPSLKDKDVWVRRHVAKGLGALKSNAAVPALIDGLEDEESVVRDAAYQSLRELTGAKLPFDPEGTASRRKAYVAKWRAWFKSRSKKGK